METPIKNELLPENLAEFRYKYGSFHDAVIHHVHYDLFSHTEPEIIRVSVGTRYRTSPEKIAWTSWTNLTFEIEPVTRVVLKKDPNYFLGVVSRLGISFFDEKVHINFLHASDLDDLEFHDEKPEDKISLIAVGKRCFWWLSPYEQRGGRI